LCQAPYFGSLLPQAVAVQSVENYFCKSSSGLAPKMLLNLTPGGRNWQMSFLKFLKMFEYKKIKTVL
jgi:hypothetical protein